ncbi:MAG: serine/threonine protein kinase [Myxococcota bacterium]|nr:serine/threonine protein kinase [Myxococcota bacterium]MDW8363629.1 serine/threonine-protein kinase [Myxococcales bacterium]
MTSTEQGAARWIGRVLDERYRIDEVLGEGGMGTVFVAEHLKLHKKVAVKMIHPDLVGNAEVAARFAREAMASAQIEHPHVVSALDYGVLDDGIAYLVVQLVRGSSLADELRSKGGLGWRDAARLCAQIADALAAAHARGIVHRDLKPDNVLLERRDDGTPLARVVDFGIARVELDARTTGAAANGAARPLTRIGTVMGTPGYMAPEQAMGETVDARADLYALGVVLWEAATGKPLYADADLTTTVARQLTEPVPRLSAVLGDPTVPPELETLLEALLAPRPSSRPASAALVRDELKRLAEAGTGSTEPAGVPPPALGTAPTLLAPHRHHAGGTTVSVLLAHRPWIVVGLIGLLALGIGATLAVALAADPPTPLVLTKRVKPPRRERAASAPERIPTREPAPRQAPPTAAAPPASATAASVIELLATGRRDERRAVARRILDAPARHGPLLVALAELELGNGCEARRAALARISELGDRAALPVLERWQRTPRRGCGFLSLVDCYACIRRPLDETIRSLQQPRAPPTGAID